MRISRAAATIGAAIAMSGAAVVSAAPAEAATVNVTLDCQGPVSVSANPGDQIVFTLGAGCPVETGGAPPGHFGGYVFSFPVIGFGWLTLDSSSNTGTGTSIGAPDFWDIRSDGSGSTSATTTLQATNPGPLVAGVSVIGYTGINGLSQFDVVWTGPQVAGPSDGGGMPDQLQQVPMPAGSTCSSVADADYRWGTGVTGGWTESWGEWARGPVCSRTLVFSPASGTWTAR